MRGAFASAGKADSHPSMASVSGTKRLSDNDVGPTHTPKIQRVEHHSSHGNSNGNGLPAAHQHQHHAGSSPHQHPHPHQHQQHQQQRLPAANNDFSGSVKRKLADSKRTGQACDRCKVSAPSVFSLALHCHAWVQCGGSGSALQRAVRRVCWLFVANRAMYTPEPPRRILHAYRPGDPLLHASRAEVSFATRRDGCAGARPRCRVVWQGGVR